MKTAGLDTQTHRHTYTSLYTDHAGMDHPSRPLSVDSVAQCMCGYIGSRAHDETQSTAIARSPERCLCFAVACMMQSKLSCLWLELQQEHIQASTTANSPIVPWVSRDQSHHHHIAQSCEERDSMLLQTLKACF